MTHLSSKTRVLSWALVLPLLAVPSIGAAQAQPAIVTQTAPVTQAPITRISFSRTPCYGFCPSYSVTLRSDGAAKWKDGQFVSRLGDRTGRIAPEKFAELARFLDASSSLLLAQMRRNTLQPRPADAPGFILSIERGAQKIEVEDYGFRAPVEFLSIEKKLDEAAANASWQFDNTGLIEAPASPRKGACMFLIRSAVAPPPPLPHQDIGRIVVAAAQKFQVTLPPGDYSVRWQDEAGSHERKVKVIEGYFASVAP